MDKETVIAILQEHAPELKAAGLVHLHLFGSVARGEANAQSDVDLLASFDSSGQLSLLALSGLQNRLSDLLGVAVDLSSAEWMKDRVRKRALQEAVLAF